MKNYLYNGVELPDISPFLKDVQTYPYVIIYKATSSYKLIQSSSKPYKESNRNFVVFPHTYGYEYILRTGKDDWEHQYDHNSVTLNIGGDSLIWTNKDILNEDGSVYFAASEPVPVEPDGYRGRDTITLGSGTLYLTEYAGETLPDVESVCVEENRMGYTKGGAALQYTEETTEEKDDLGLAYKIITTKTDVVLKCGLITWNGETLLKLIDRCTTVIQDGKRVVKIGGRGNAKGAKYVVVFHHEDPIDGDLWAMIVGHNTAGLTVTCTTEAGALLEPEFRAAPHDTDGTLVRLIEGSRTN